MVHRYFAKRQGFDLTHQSTGKSLSEALIFASTNPQYDDRLFMKIVSSEYLQNNFAIHNNFGTQNVLQMLRASEKDLTVIVPNMGDICKICEKVC
jgi:hypothetical protein